MNFFKNVIWQINNLMAWIFNELWIQQIVIQWIFLAPRLLNLSVFTLKSS